jgi:hypothetical protein
MPDQPLRANSVEVEAIRRACCRLDGCGWKGGEHPDYAAANAERQAHLDWHRLGKAGEAP